MKLNWGSGIALVYALFAAATTGFVVFAMKQPVDLVSPDYYGQSLKQDARQQATERAVALGDQMSMSLDESRRVNLQLPEAMAGDAKGSVTFYRASDARADVVSSLSLDAQGRQRISVDHLAAGPWKVEIEWSVNGLAYYREVSIWVP